MIRIGSGYDIHAFDLSNPGEYFITICGIKIPFKFKIIAHSDGDLGLHAITDALLGSLALGSIGTYFPPSEKKWQNASSKIFLDFAYNKIIQASYRLNNLDITFITQEPKIMPYATKMREFLSEALMTEEDNINIKAVTPEFLGAIGRIEGIAIQVSLLIIKL
jgi:2-C-methyl-D-erythritol 2,4-cyclodiphosphate synthase